MKITKRIYLFAALIISSACSYAQEYNQDIQVNPFRGLKSLDVSRGLTLTAFKNVYYDGQTRDESNYPKKVTYEALKNQFNSEWENLRINARTTMNELRSQLVLTAAKWQLLESQRVVLASEIVQLGLNRDNKRKLIENYKRSEVILSDLKDNLLNNYLYYGIFYTEFDVPDNHVSIEEINVEQFRDYGERLITNEIKDSYIKTIVNDSIWLENGIEVKRELIKAVEMLNISGSFHMALDMGGADGEGSNITKHLVLAAALFKNDGSSKVDNEALAELDEELKAFQVLDDLSSGIRSNSLYRNQKSTSRINEITDLILASKSLEDREQKDLIERIEKWNKGAMNALGRINTSNALDKWEKELATFKHTSQQIVTEKGKVIRDIEELENLIDLKQVTLKKIQTDLDDEKEDWLEVNPIYEEQVARYFNLVKHQQHYALVSATNPRSRVSRLEAAYEATENAINRLKNDRVKELLKTVRQDVNGFRKLIVDASVNSQVSIEKIAFMGYDYRMGEKGTEVELDIAVKMSLSIPDGNIKKPRPLLPPWKSFRFNEETLVVRDVSNNLEWKRIKLSEDENDYGNDFLNENKFPPEVKAGNWRVPEMEDFLLLKVALENDLEKLRAFQIVVQDPYPFWTNTLADNGTSPFVVKKGALIKGGAIEFVDVEISDQGYFLFVRDIEGQKDQN